jgi:YD repeat-containing protein
MEHPLSLRTNRILFIGFLLFAQFVFLKTNAQGALQPGSSIKTDLPVILPPSPTVASLMKFEEIAVNNYTGIPNISLPIYSFPTHSKDLTVDISLNYHPSSIAANEVASYVGLGWNLLAGGTISRTVKGLPDDMINSITNAKHGIHDPLNKYYAAISFLSGSMGALTTEDFLHFLWDVQVSGINDSEHDLYQFNFMGHTGRFFIEKSLGGVYNVVKLDNDNAMRIEYNNNSKIFTIYDDKGLKYIFDEKESTVTGTSVGNQYLHGVDETNLSNGYTYNSAFHLTKVYDTNNKLLVKFNMNTILMKENTRIVNTTFSRIDRAEIINPYGEPTEVSATQLTAYLDQDDHASLKRMMPQKSITAQNMNRNTKKLESIDIIDYGKVIFENIADRYDSKLNEYSSENAYRLNSITIKDSSNTQPTQVRKFTLHHSYSTILDKRLMLSGITEHHEGLEKKHELKYNIPYNYVQHMVGIDYWGFFNYRPDNYPATAYRDSDKDYCKADVLEKITYPTGGCAIFDFESNTYSYIGEEAINNFDENPDNFTTQYIDLNFLTVNGGSSTKYFYVMGVMGSSTNNLPVNVSFVPKSATDEAGQSGIFSLFKVVNGALVQPLIGGIGCGTIDGTCITDDFLLQPGNYAVVFGPFTQSPLSGSLQVRIKRPVPIPNEYLYGGGVRIKRIAYYDTDVPANYIGLLDFPDPDGDGIFPVKVRKYDYRFFGQGTRTSGALSFPKPKYNYSLRKECYLHLLPLQFGQGSISIGVDVYSTINTTFNNLLNLRTQGSDVGYQNVTVFEEGNGKTEFTYTSPISDPEIDYELTYPFQPSSNIDYRRGLLLKSTVYEKHNNIFRKLNIQMNQYEIIEDVKLTGLTIFPLENYCRNLYQHTFYSYISCINSGYINNTTNYCLPLNYCDNFIDFVRSVKFFEKFGWPQLKNTTTTDFFYDEQGVPSTLTQSQSYEYNPVNKRISSSTLTNVQNDVLKTDYFYHFANSIHTKNRMGEIQQINSYKNGQPISSNKIVYATGINGNASQLPQVVQSAKGTAALEHRLRYNRYDQFGNILEVQQENGTKICYIWGYNHSQPVAKIENIAYSTIPTYLITSIQSATTEGELLTALIDLRTSLTAAMVTTYTYIPLVGISTVTDPKGYKTTYTYDALGRLSTVKDHDGKFLSTNTYNYRPQN